MNGWRRITKGLADYDLFLETAIGLLEETIEEKK
jgi:hypothetical protein